MRSRGCDERRTDCGRTPRWGNHQGGHSSSQLLHYIMNESLSPSPLNPQMPRGIQSIHLRRRVFGVIAKYGTIIGMLLMIVVFSIAAPSYFFTLSNFVNILNQSSLTGIIAG